MISREELTKRVAQRRQEMETESAKLREMRSKLADFLSDVKGRSVIYNLVKSLPLWKEIEQLITQSDAE